MFAKYWEPRQVKTRLAASLGPIAASELYRGFVATLAHRFREMGDRRVIGFTPAERRAEFADLGGSHWELQSQSQGHLGERLAQFFDEAFRRGAGRVVLIGSDSPTLPVSYVERAFQRLAECDVVLGPTDDGGYYLVGASRPVNVMFHDIDWSTPRVWEQTIARLAQHQLTYETLPPWYDVDELPDLQRLQGELSQMQADELPWQDLRNAVNEVL